MTIEEIRLSGLLESYILGDLRGSQLAEVEQHLIDFPELTSDIKQIERAFRAYAEVNGIPPRPELKSEIIKSVTGKSVPPGTSPPKSGMGPFFFPALILLGLLGLSWFWGNNNAKKYDTLSEEYTAYQEVCDSISDRNDALQNIITNISSPNNRTIIFSPTGNYPATNLVMHINEDEGSNYIQATALPTLNADQAFQLWSLKDGQAPIPLTVFTSQLNQIIEVDFEGGTGTYAITIEPIGGSQAPNLEELVGTIRV